MFVIAFFLSINLTLDAASYLFYDIIGSINYIALVIIIGVGLIITIVLAYKGLKFMRTTLRHTYVADIHGLSARLSTKIIMGLPILGYLAMTMMSAELSTK